MREDFKNRVRKTVLPESKPLLPVFEAMINSLDSIEESGLSDGEIVLQIEREKELEAGQIPHISGFRIIDNGLGFNEENYVSFDTADSSKKSNTGGLGVGRFLWLKAFKKVSIDSKFRFEDKIKRRRFDFMLSEDGIENHLVDVIDGSEPAQTVVHLDGYLDSYKEICPRSAEEVAFQFINHCLSLFLRNEHPAIYITDADGTRVDVNKLFNDTLKKKRELREIVLKGIHFSLSYFELDAAAVKNHMVYFCARGREVISIHAKKYLPDLAQRLPDEQGDFVFAIYIDSQYLDQNVSQERIAFTIPQKRPNQACPVSWEEIEKAIIDELGGYLGEYIAPVREQKIETYTRFVHEEAPRFRSLLKHHKDKVLSLEPGLSNRKLTTELSKIEFDVLEETKKLVAEILGDAELEFDRETYKAKLNKVIDEIDDIGRSRLAEYVSHRKVILDLFDKALNIQKDGRFKLEEYLHQIICPMRVTSDDIAWDRQNLWILDERLAFHKYLASDKTISSFDVEELDSGKEPDVCIYNNPAVYSDDNGGDDSVILVEFKRPQRDDYTLADNPVQQLFEYVSKLREGRAKNRFGQYFPKNESRRYYCYAVCDLTPSLHKVAAGDDWEYTADRAGYFKYHRGYKAYVTVVSYKKVLDDALKRNRIFFEKLGVE